MSPTPVPDQLISIKNQSSDDAKDLVPLTNFTNNASTINTGDPKKVTTHSAGPALPSWVLEEREAARIAHRRRILQERAVRIHQPRATSISVDVSALSHQVEERCRKEEEERRKDVEYSRLALTQDRAGLLLQHQENKDRENKRQQLVRFWREEQQPDRRREYDLNCHEHITSTLYKLSFDGEDLGMPERLKQQKRETKAWLEQQQEEKRQHSLREKEKNRMEELKQMNIVEKARELAKADEECRKALELAHFQYNKLLSREKSHAREEEILSDKKAEEQEVRNAVLGTFLTEDPEMAHSAFGPHRVVVDRWKGMSPEQKREIEHIRAQQIEEKRIREEADRRRSRDWDEHANRADKAGLLFAHKEDLYRRSQEDQLLATNNGLAREQKLNQSRINSILTTNVPTQEYYRHFGVYPR